MLNYPLKKVEKINEINHVIESFTNAKMKIINSQINKPIYNPHHPTKKKTPAITWPQPAPHPENPTSSANTPKKTGTLIRASQSGHTQKRDGLLSQKAEFDGFFRRQSNILISKQQTT